MNAGASGKLLVPVGGVADPLQRIRVSGGVRMAFVAGANGTFAAEVAEADGHRVRFPRHAGGCEAVLINTGGGIASGDSVSIEATLAPAADVTVTSVGCERIYRARIDPIGAAPARLSVRLVLQDNARLAYLPHDTIVCSGAHLKRRIDVDLAASSVLTLADCLVLGRRGFGERMLSGHIDDQWSIRRTGRLVHREALRLTGAIDAFLQRQAVGGGAHVTATLVHVAPMAEDLLQRVRRALAACKNVECAASAWDGRLVVRALGDRSDHVRRAISAAAQAVIDRPLPAAWAT